MNTAALIKGTERQKRERLAQGLEKLRRMAPTNVAAHAAFVHRDDEEQPMRAYRHHLEWIDLVLRPLEHPWLGIVAPPGYAKSTWFSIVYPTWRIGSSGGRVRLGLVSNTAEQAWGFAGAVKDAIESERFRMAYPGVVPDKDRGWRHNAFYMSGAPAGQNPTLAAMGIGGPILGRRFDEIILDDPITYEQALSPSQMTKYRNWLKNTLIKRFPAGKRPPNNPEGQARMVVVFTRWGPNDLYDTLEDMGFHMVTMPAIGYWDRELVVDDQTGQERWEWGVEPLWPEKEPLSTLERERELDPLTFEQVMQGNPNVVIGTMFDPVWWAERRGRPPDRQDFDRVVMAVDTASGADAKKGDFYVAAVLGLHGTDVWVLDIVRGRFNAMQQEDVTETTAAHWKPDLLVIEAVNEGEALYQRLVARHLGLPLKRFKPTKDKAFRAAPLAAAYRQGHVWHVEGAGWAMSYEAELQAFPQSEHDDQVDAAAMAYSNLSDEGPRVRSL